MSLLKSVSGTPKLEYSINEASPAINERIDNIKHKRAKKLNIKYPLAVEPSAKIRKQDIQLKQLKKKMKSNKTATDSSNKSKIKTKPKTKICKSNGVLLTQNDHYVLFSQEPSQDDRMTKSNLKLKKMKTGNKNTTNIMPLSIVKTPRKATVMQSILTEQLSNSVIEGGEKFAWIINPVGVDQFMSEYWEKKPLLVQRSDSKYYDSLLSRAKIDEMLRTHNIEYTKNIDVTSYRDGKRETHNPEGRVLPPDMWQFYTEGCSVRMLNPQTYMREIYEMNAKLQEFFHCMVGANFYLTPPNSQGFAPHYDDIEAFVLQIEGRKHWKLYNPRSPAEVLARTSSPNFDQNEIGEPCMEVVLKPGDLLYFPRGVIHQACTVPGHHSLHITMSVYQKNSWADLLEIFLPLALAQAVEDNVELRTGIPIDLHNHFGIIHSDDKTPSRKQFANHIKSLIDKIFSEEALDHAVDQLAKRFQHDALPPLLTANERPGTVYGSNYQYNKDGTVNLGIAFEAQTKLRLLRRNILRLVNEEDKLLIYYSTDNSREYHEYEPNFLEVDEYAAPGVELLSKSYPQYITIGDLPVEDKVDFAKSLWEKGLVTVYND